MEAFLKGDYSGTGVKKLNDFLNLLYKKLFVKCPFIPEEMLRALIHQAFCGSVLLCVAMPNAFKDLLQFDFTDREKRKSNLILLLEITAYGTIGRVWKSGNSYQGRYCAVKKQNNDSLTFIISREISLFFLSPS